MRFLPTHNDRRSYCTRACAFEHCKQWQAEQPRKPKRMAAPMPPRACDWCKTVFHPRMKTHRLCSNECRRMDGLERQKRKRMHDDPYDFTCTECGEVVTVQPGRGHPTKFCSTGCGKRVAKRTRKARKRASRVRLPAKPVTMATLIRRDGARCAYCSCKVQRRDHEAGDAATIDHILPLSRGGWDHPLNAVVACRSCNSLKCDSLDWCSPSHLPELRRRERLAAAS